MPAKSVLLFFFVTFGVSAEIGARYGGGRCPPDEFYTNCGSACQKTCEKPNPQACTLQCVAGCFCNDGLVRDEFGTCTPIDECPQTELGPGQCPRGEVWNNCGIKCQPTCHKRFPACDKTCHAACYCPAGWIRQDDSYLSPCIPIGHCGK